DALRALGEDVEHDLAEGLHDGEIGNVLPLPFELAGREDASFADDRRLQLAHERGLPDPGVPGDENQLGPAVRSNALEGLFQGGELGRPTVELLGDEEAIGRVVLPEWEGRDLLARAPPLQAALEIVRESERALVALLGNLGEQLAHDVGDGTRNRRTDRSRR